jgi:hypothetical protein
MSKDKFDRSKQQVVYITLEELAGMIGITMDKPKKKKNEKSNK